jgi:hypothetical protein
MAQDKWLDDMLNWLEQSKAKQAQLHAQNIARPEMVGPEMSTGSYAMQMQRNQQDLAKARPAAEDWWRAFGNTEGIASEYDLGKHAASSFIDPETGKPITGDELTGVGENRRPKYKPFDDPSWQDVYKNSPKVKPVVQPNQGQWNQKYPANSWQGRLWDQKHAPQLFPQGGMPSAQPMQGGATGPGGYATPEAQAGGKTFEGYDQTKGNAPGAAGGQARGFNPDSMTWDEYQRGQDEAFRRRSAIWDEQENAKNAQEDAARLRAGQGPSNWYTNSKLFTPRDAADWNRGLKEYWQNQDAKAAQAKEWQKYLEVMKKYPAPTYQPYGPNGTAEAQNLELPHWPQTYEPGGHVINLLTKLLGGASAWAR